MNDTTNAGIAKQGNRPNQYVAGRGTGRGGVARKTFPRKPAAFLALVLLCLLAGGGWFYLAQEKHFQRNAEELLETIAKLKTKDIAEWRSDQLAEGGELTASRFFAAGVAQWLETPHPEQAKEIRSRLSGLKDHYGYRDVLLADPEGRVRLSLSGRLDPLCADVVRTLSDVARDRIPILTDLHAEGDAPPHLGVIAPLFNGTGPEAAMVGAMVLICDAETMLYPFIQGWPIPSESSETLLVRRDGDSVLFLNELRHQSNTALRLRIPLTRTDVPAVRAALGVEGVVRGRDYRGIEVLAVAKAIPDSHWYLVAKMDVEEVFAEWRAQSLLILVVLFGFLVLSATAGLFAWQRNAKVHYRALYDSEAALRQNEESLRLIQKQAADELKAANQQLTASNQQLRATEQQLRASNQQLKAANQQLRATEESLRDSEERLRAVAESLDGILYAVDTEMRFTLSKGRKMAVLGRKQDEMVGKSLYDFLMTTDSDHPTLVAHRRALAGEVVQLETTLGGVVFSAVLSPIRTVRGTITGVVGLAIDITDRKRAEEALKQSETFTRTVMDHLPVGLAVNSVEPTVEFVYMNDNFPRIYRTTREALATPDAFWEVVYEDPVFREELRNKVEEDCASGDLGRMRWENIPITRTEQETTYISARNMPVPGTSLMISAVWDVTELKRAELEREKLQSQLTQAQKLESIGRLAGGVAHDFNNILQAITGYGQLLLDNLSETDRTYEFADEIVKEANRAATLTRQLLAFARKQTVLPRVLDLNDSISGMLRMLRRLIGEDIDLTWMPGAELWPVRMDPSQLDQILANLCVNARDAIAGAGAITIETANVTVDDTLCRKYAEAVPGDYVVCAFSDDGHGMTPDVREHAFEPFFTTKGVGEGTGLGLATVYGIVRQNNGFITLYSEPDNGTTFRIYLPRLEGEPPEEEMPATTAEANRPRGSETILLVEDDKSVRTIATQLLTDLGYTVLTAQSPHQALRISEGFTDSIHLMITDVVMPGLSGRQLAAQLAETRPELKVLYISGYTSNVIAHRGILDADVQFLSKPFTREQLAGKVREILDSGPDRADGGKPV